MNNNINNNSTIDMRLYSPKRYFKIIPTTLTKNRINSIPSKQNSLGYDFDENGLPVIVDPPAIISDINEENEKNIINNKKSDKKINALDWSKMSRKNISDNDITTKDNTINNNSSNLYYNNNTSKDLNGLSNHTTNTSNYIRNRQISSNESRINYLNKNRNNKSLLNSNESLTTYTNNEITSDNNRSAIYKSFSEENIFKKINKIKGNLYKTTNRDIIKKEPKISVEDFVYNNLFKGDPGPGYYQEQSDFDKYILISNKNRRFNFGSNEKKDKNIYSSSLNVNICPGYYFQENNTPKFKPKLYPLSRK